MTEQLYSLCLLLQPKEPSFIQSPLIKHREQKHVTTASNENAWSYVVTMRQCDRSSLHPTNMRPPTIKTDKNISPGRSMDGANPWANSWHFTPLPSCSYLGSALILMTWTFPELVQTQANLKRKGRHVISFTLNSWANYAASKFYLWYEWLTLTTHQQKRIWMNNRNLKGHPTVCSLSQ